MGAIVLLGELTARTKDRIIASGEKMSVRLLSLALNNHGLSGIALDADTFLETDDHFGEANPLGVVAVRTIRAALKPHLSAGKTPVVTGFCGIAPDGATTTLGRGGSDWPVRLMPMKLRFGPTSMASLATIHVWYPMHDVLHNSTTGKPLN